MFFFFKQKTAYEMRISDWISDVCSSDLRCRRGADAVTLEERCRRSKAGRRCKGKILSILPIVTTRERGRMDGLMQNVPLTVDRNIDHAANWHGAREAVARDAEGRVTRSAYAERKRGVVGKGGSVRGDLGGGR